MSSAEYFNVFESIFYGLILTQILAGWNKQIRDFGTYTFYWAHLMLTITLFLAVVQRYYGKYHHWGIEYKTIDGSLDLFYQLVLMPSLLYVASSQSFPKKFEGIDLQEFCLKVRWKFTIPIGCYLTIQIITNIQNGLGLVWIIPHLAIIVTGILASVLRHKRLLELTIVLSFIAIGYFLWET